MFDANRRLHKYKNVQEIIEDFYLVRLELYGKRKEHMVELLQHKLMKLSNKAKYIQETLKGTVDLRKKNVTQVEELMKHHKFDKIDGDFKYLIKMPMDSVTEENVKHIMKEKDDAKQELDVLMNTTIYQMWLHELEVFTKHYEQFKKKREDIQNGITKIVKKKSKK